MIFFYLKFLTLLYYRYNTHTYDVEVHMDPMY